MKFYYARTYFFSLIILVSANHFKCTEETTSSIVETAAESVANTAGGY